MLFDVVCCCFFGLLVVGAHCRYVVGLLCMLVVCWLFVGLLLVVCWLFVGLLLVCCWFVVGLLLVCCWFVVSSYKFCTCIGRFLGAIKNTIKSDITDMQAPNDIAHFCPR